MMGALVAIIATGMPFTMINNMAAYTSAMINPEIIVSILSGIAIGGGYEYKVLSDYKKVFNTYNKSLGNDALPEKTTLNSNEKQLLSNDVDRLVEVTNSILVDLEKQKAVIHDYEENNAKKNKKQSKNNRLSNQDDYSYDEEKTSSKSR